MEGSIIKPSTVVPREWNTAAHVSSLILGDSKGRLRDFKGARSMGVALFSSDLQAHKQNPKASWHQLTQENIENNKLSLTSRNQVHVHSAV